MQGLPASTEGPSPVGAGPARPPRTPSPRGRGGGAGGGPGKGGGGGRGPRGGGGTEASGHARCEARARSRSGARGPRLVDDSGRVAGPASAIFALLEEVHLQGIGDAPGPTPDRRLPKSAA